MSLEKQSKRDDTKGWWSMKGLSHGVLPSALGLAVSVGPGLMPAEQSSPAPGSRGQILWQYETGG